MSGEIASCLWFDGNAEEAVQFLPPVFTNAVLGTISRYGEAMPFPAGTAMMIEFTQNGQRFQALNGGPSSAFPRRSRSRCRAPISRRWIVTGTR